MKPCIVDIDAIDSVKRFSINKFQSTHDALNIFYRFKVSLCLREDLEHMLNFFPSRIGVRNLKTFFSNFLQMEIIIYGMHCPLQIEGGLRVKILEKYVGEDQKMLILEGGCIIGWNQFFRGGGSGV